MGVGFRLLFFFFKQKTAYEMRISDWSSDVCSSDLPDRLRCPAAGRGRMTKAHNVDAQRLSFILNELRLPAIKVIWPEFTERADKEGWPATRLLAALTEHEMAERDRRRIEGSVANEVGLFDPIRGDFSGARLPFSPKWQSSLSADYSLPLGGVNLTMGTTISSQSKSLEIGRAHV